MEPVSNPDLQLAFDFVRFTNRNIFLTGKAGTGKTTFLHNLKKTSPKRMVVMAPTGVAAINAGGVTIHSFFQLPFHPYIPSLYLSGTPAKTSEQRENSGYRMSREKINIIKSLDLLVIDEISMVRADTLDAIDAALRRYRNHQLVFGGVQVLMIGDLQQLAPVVKDDDMALLREYYEIFFFFGSRALSSTNYVTIELKHIYRQSDPVFINLLNKVRENRIDREVLDELNSRYIPDFNTAADGGYITLTTHNNQASTINDSKLAKLPGEIHSYRAVIRDDFPELSYPNVEELILKEGAQVMFVKNDISANKLYFNGKIGIVEDFEDDVIIVKCPEDDFSIRVEPVEWQNVKYTLDDETKEIQETVIGTFTQHPLKLAWAITIHKSQGLTFDRAVIDARSAFAHGQVYVALSRCRTLSGIVMNSRIGQKSIIDDPVITGFVRKTEQNQPGDEMLSESMRSYQMDMLSELFDFTGLARNVSYCIKLTAEHNESILGNPGAKLEKALACISEDLVEVSEKFKLQIKKLSDASVDAESNIQLQERIKKAVEFFSGRLEASLGDIIKDFSIETDNKTVRKSFNEALGRLKKESAAKFACLKSAQPGFRLSEYLEARARTAIDDATGKSYSAKKADDDSGTILHPGLFNRLKEWRREKAAEKHIPHYTILHQKTLLRIVNNVPRSISALRQVKGMGRRKCEKYGEELLEIITSFCEEKNIEPGAGITAQDQKPKKAREETKKISLNLFREGKSVLQIAAERNLSVTTIESHLAHFVSTGDLRVSEFVTEKLKDLIVSHLGEDLRMGPVKAILGDEVTWSDLRFVVNHVKFIRSGIQQAHTP